MKTIFRKLGILFLISALLITFVFPSVSNAQSVTGVDQVLSAFAGVVKERANEVALGIVRDQIVAALNNKTITLPAPAKGQKPATLYLGGTTGDENHYFQKTFLLLNGSESLSITDPFLLKTLSKEFVDFAFRIIVGITDEAAAVSLDLKGISNFIYQSIQIMSSPGSDIHTLSRLMLQLSDDINSGYAEKYSAVVSQKSGTTVDLPYTEVESSFTDAVSFAAYMKLNESNLDEKQTRDTFQKCDKNFIGKYNYKKDVVFKSYLEANVSGNKEIGDFFNLVGSFLYADSIDSQETLTWLKNFGNMVVSNISPDSENPQVAFQTLEYKLKTTPELSSPSAVNNTLTESFDRVLVDLALRYYTTPKSAFVGDGISNIYPKITALLADMESLGMLKNPTPEAVGAKIANLMKSFADLLNTTNSLKVTDDTATPEFMNNTADVLTVVANHDWLNLVQLSYEKVRKLDPDNKTGATNILGFVRILLQMYGASSVADAQQILTSNLESISSRNTRFNNSCTFDIACLLGLREGYEDVQNPFPRNGDGEINLVGLYAPLGFQVGIQNLGLMLYPIDLGTYLTSSGQTNNSQVSDAIRLGVATYLRIQSIPLAFGIGGDARPSMNGVDPIYRVFGFASLELPLFVIK